MKAQEELGSRVEWLERLLIAILISNGGEIRVPLWAQHISNQLPDTSSLQIHQYHGEGSKVSRIMLRNIESI